MRLLQFSLLLIIPVLISFQAPVKPVVLRTGKHLLTLQWISTDKPGSVVLVAAANGKYSIKGSQRNKSGDFVTIDGFIRPVNNRELEFEGVIVTQVSYINQGRPCERKGHSVFKATGSRKYWRLQQMENCEGGMVVDYVDIYF